MELVRLILKILVFVLVMLLVTALIGSIMNNNMTSLLNVLTILLVVTMCLPQTRDIIEGRELLQLDDSKQILWWIFLGAAITEVIHFFQSYHLKNYVGALCALMVTVLLISLALPHRKYALYRTPLAQPT